MDNINSPFGYNAATRRPVWDSTAQPQPPPRRRANSLQHASVTSPIIRPTRRSLFNTTVVCVTYTYYIWLGH